MPSLRDATRTAGAAIANSLQGDAATPPCRQQRSCQFKTHFSNLTLELVLVKDSKSYTICS
ncbi:hypothetical protein LC608_34065 [Nostoc sp. XA010]|uniref:hypothetical protein n=1 Tax=Nostoc sp. XA010 TaxID=2780407 RepID=UPI001E282816|nr:hypothetical protein [Nostoc sp. XA010]MCC5661881.1 hypothetical protein [Nostoc sp. XA010]